VTGANASPVAVFTVECDQGGCSFDAIASYDSDGALSAYAWDFGDGSSVETTDALFSHEYTTTGDYLVQLTVTDDLAATGTAESWISVVVAADPFVLSASSQKRRGSKSVQLTWSGALTAQVDIFRNGSFLTTTGNDGEYTDSSLPKRSKSVSYQVCQAGEPVCSNEFTVKL
jgi:serine protease